MRHCVFGASTKCVDAVAAAEKAMEKLITSWMVEEDCAECRFHSSFVCVKGELNVEIYLSNKDEHQLIADCMEFARESRIWNEQDEKNYCDLLCLLNCWQDGKSYTLRPKRAYDMRQWLKGRLGWPESKRPPIEYLTWEDFLKTKANEKEN